MLATSDYRRVHEREKFEARIGVSVGPGTGCDEVDQCCWARHYLGEGEQRFRRFGIRSIESSALSRSPAAIASRAAIPNACRRAPSAAWFSRHIYLHAEISEQHRIGASVIFLRVKFIT